MIEVKNLRRTYGDFELELSFQGPERGILCLLGSSGSGKTSSLRLIAGFDRPERGQILLFGEDITALHPARRGLGYVFQDYALFPHLSVEGNIEYGLRSARIPKPERRRRVHELLELTGLLGFEGRDVKSLSGGEQQRVALARALAPEPRALLLDEPFSAVDPERREELGRYLLDLQTRLGIPMVFVTHSRSEAMRLGASIALLNQGRLVEQGSPNQLYQRPRQAYTARFLGKANIFPREIWLGMGLMPPPGPADHELMLRPECLSAVAIPDSRGAPPFRVRHASFSPPAWEYALEGPEDRLLWMRTEEEFAPGQELHLAASRFHELSEPAH